MDKVHSMARRSFLAQVAGGGLILAAGILVAEPAEARRQPRRMVVDRDPRDPARSGWRRGRVLRRVERPDSSRFVICPGHRRCPRRRG